MHSATIAYSNDFDGIVVTDTGVTASVSGGDQNGGGTTSGQGFNAYSGFSGDLWRVTAEDDKLIIQVNGLDPNSVFCTGFSLAMIDSWDGTSGRYGTDVINMEIFDGGTVSGNTVTGGTSVASFSNPYNNSSDLDSTGYVDSVIVSNTQLGFNNANPYWNEDGLEMQVDNLQTTTGTLTFTIWASSAGTGTGFQGGNDESFGIDNFTITDKIPEPSSAMLLLLTLGCLTFKRARR